eukprot:8630580-Pyramimonas_sp.AAC.1
MRLSIPQTRDAASSPMVPLAKDLPEDYDGSAPSEELTPQKNSEPAPGDVSGDLETLENEVSELSSELEQLKAERDDLRSTEVCRVRVTQGRTTVRGVHSSAVAGSGLVRENETIKRQLKELATTTEELEERLKQPPPSLPTTHHDDDGVDQILLQLFVPTSHCSVKCSTLPSVGGFDSGYHLHMCVRELSC